MNRRDFIKRGCLTAGATITSLPPIESSVVDSRNSSAGETPDFLAREIATFINSESDLYQRNGPAAALIPFASETVARYMTTPEEKDGLLHPKPKIEPLLEELRAGRRDLMDQVHSILWEEARKTVVDEMKRIESRGVKASYEQIDFIPKRWRALTKYGKEVHFSASRFCTSRYVSDIPEVDVCSLATMLGSGSYLALTLRDVILENERKAFDSQTTKERPDLAPTYCFYRHTPACLVVKRDAWMVEIYHYLSVCGVFSTWEVE